MMVICTCACAWDHGFAAAPAARDVVWAIPAISQKYRDDDHGQYLEILFMHAPSGSAQAQ